MGSGAGHRGPALRFAASAAGSATAPCPRWSTRRLRLACGRAAAGSVVARVEPPRSRARLPCPPPRAGSAAQAVPVPTRLLPPPVHDPGQARGPARGPEDPGQTTCGESTPVSSPTVPSVALAPGPAPSGWEFHQDHPDHHLPDGRQPHRPPDQQPRPRRARRSVVAERQASAAHPTTRHTRRHGTPHSDCARSTPCRVRHRTPHLHTNGRDVAAARGVATSCPRAGGATRLP